MRATCTGTVAVTVALAAVGAWFVFSFVDLVFGRFASRATILALAPTMRATSTGTVAVTMVFAAVGAELVLGLIDCVPGRGAAWLSLGAGHNAQ